MKPRRVIPHVDHRLVYTGRRYQLVNYAPEKAGELAACLRLHPAVSSVHWDKDLAELSIAVKDPNHWVASGNNVHEIIINSQSDQQATFA